MNEQARQRDEDESHIQDQPSWMRPTRGGVPPNGPSPGL